MIVIYASSLAFLVISRHPCFQYVLIFRHYLTHIYSYLNTFFEVKIVIWTGNILTLVCRYGSKTVGLDSITGEMLKYGCDLFLTVCKDFICNWQLKEYHYCSLTNSNKRECKHGDSEVCCLFIACLYQPWLWYWFFLDCFVYLVQFPVYLYVDNRCVIRKYSGHFVPPFSAINYF